MGKAQRIFHARRSLRASSADFCRLAPVGFITQLIVDVGGTPRERGTQLRDAFMSIIETAIKLGISPFDFIYDRITKQYKMPSLATVIYPGISQTF